MIRIARLAAAVIFVAVPAVVGLDSTTCVAASESLQEQVLDDLADGDLDNHSLFSAAIILSGADRDSHVDSFEDQLDHFTRQALYRIDASNSRDRAHKLLDFLHDQLLIGQYDAGCSDVRELFANGKYNCVTATIVYLAIARRLDSDWADSLAPVALPGHVRCQLSWEAEKVVIETTSPTWPSETMEMHEGLTPRRLSDVQLLAKLVYNRGLQQMETKEYESALVSTELSWQLDKEHEAARENVVAIINNWALALCGQRQFDQAIELLEQGQSLAPGFDTLRRNQLHVYLRWASSERNAEKHQVAASVLREAQDKFPDESVWD